MSYENGYEAPRYAPRGRSSRGRGNRGSRGRGAYSRGGRGNNIDGRGRRPPPQIFDPSEPVPARVLTSLLTKSGGAEELIELYANHGETFNHVHISAFWNTMGKHVKRNYRHRRYLDQTMQRDPATFESARCATIRLLPSVGARELSNVAHGLASVGLSSSGKWEPLWAAIEGAVCQDHLHDLSSQGLANSIWAFATAGHASTPFYEVTGAKVIEEIEEFSPQGIANTAWAFATAGVKSRGCEDLFTAISREMMRRDICDFKPQEL